MTPWINVNKTKIKMTKKSKITVQSDSELSDRNVSPFIKWETIYGLRSILFADSHFDLIFHKNRLLNHLLSLIFFDWWNCLHKLAIAFDFKHFFLLKINIMILRQYHFLFLFERRATQNGIEWNERNKTRNKEKYSLALMFS